MTPREPLTLEVGKKVNLRNGWTDTITNCSPDSEWPWGGSLGSWTDSGKHYADDNLDILHVLAEPADEAAQLAAENAGLRTAMGRSIELHHIINIGSVICGYCGRESDAIESVPHPTSCKIGRLREALAAATPAHPRVARMLAAEVLAEADFLCYSGGLQFGDIDKLQDARKAYRALRDAK